MRQAQAQGLFVHGVISAGLGAVISCNTINAFGMEMTPLLLAAAGVAGWEVLRNRNPIPALLGFVAVVVAGAAILEQDASDSLSMRGSYRL